ncbi:unnamed protein product, partial [Amoebophrya sp. A25]
EASDAIASLQSGGGGGFSVRQRLAAATAKWVETFAKPEQSALELLEVWENKAQNLDYLDQLDLPTVLEKAGIKLPPGLQNLLPGSSSPKAGKSSRGNRDHQGSTSGKSRGGHRNREKKGASQLLQSKTLASLNLSASDFTTDPVNAISKILGNERVAAKADLALGKVDGILKQVNTIIPSDVSAIQNLLGLGSLGGTANDTTAASSSSQATPSTGASGTSTQIYSDVSSSSEAVGIPGGVSNSGQALSKVGEEQDQEEKNVVSN